MPPILLKHHSLANDDDHLTKKLLIGLSALILLASVFLYVDFFNGNDVGTYYAISKIIAIILIFLYGFLFLEEVIDCRKIMGMLLGLVSIYLLTM